MNDEATTAIATRVSPLDAFEADVLAIGNDVAPETLLAVLDKADAIKARMKDICKTLEELAIAWIQANGPIYISAGVYHYVGTSRTTRCKDVPATVEALLNACGGDMQTFCSHLASQAVKHGASKQTLDPETYDRLFEVVEAPTLENGKPPLRFLKADKRFQRPSAPYDLK